jgi:hypothetical protein
MPMTTEPQFYIADPAAFSRRVAVLREVVFSLGECAFNQDQMDKVRDLVELLKDLKEMDRGLN